MDVIDYELKRFDLMKSEFDMKKVQKVILMRQQPHPQMMQLIPWTV